MKGLLEEGKEETSGLMRIIPQVKEEIQNIQNSKPNFLTSLSQQS